MLEKWPILGFILGLLPPPLRVKLGIPKGFTISEAPYAKKVNSNGLLKTARSAPTSDSLQIIIFSHFTRISRSCLPLLFAGWNTKKSPLTHLQGINPWVGSQPLRPAGRFVLSEVVISDGTAFFRLEMEADCGPLRSRCWGCNTRLPEKISSKNLPIHILNKPNRCENSHITGNFYVSWQVNACKSLDM